MDTNEMQEQAYLPIIKIAGSILVLSVAFKNIGIDFTPVMQAWTTRIANSVEIQDNTQVMDKLEEIEQRLIRVEKLAHDKGGE